MSHEFESGVFNRQGAWHGLGRIYTDEKVLTAEKAIELADLDWEVEKVPVYTMHEDDDNLPVQVADKYAIQRKTDRKNFGIVGSKYSPIQNKDGFDYLTSLVDDGELEIETAISLYGGRVVTIVANRPNHILVAGEKISEHLVFTNTHDGYGAAKVFFTPVRIVCANTQRMALSKIKNYYSIRHTGDTIAKLQDAREALKLSFSFMEELKAIGDELVLDKISGKQFVNYLDGFLPVPDKEKHPRAHRTALGHRTGIARVYRDSENLENIRPTKWGAYQATLEYLDHNVEYKSIDKRFAKIIEGYDVKTEALRVLQTV